MKMTHKYLARFIIEADTPFAVGSGEKGFTVDRLIVRDALGLPYIPGSSLAGILRHALDPEDNSAEIKKLFGFQEKDNGQGSRINFSSAHLIGADGNTVIEGLQIVDYSDGYYGYFSKLPERDHVRMNDKGAADTKGHGKFDEELVHKGTRFAFSIELSGDGSDAEVWSHVLDFIHQPMFRIGAGTRKGFGKLKVISCKTNVFALKTEEDLLAYLTFGNSLNEDVSSWQEFEAVTHSHEGWTHYQLQLKPKNFFLFGAGYGDEDVDNKPKTERYFDWTSGRPVLIEKDWLLIPASSIKGALSHRVAFHYNRMNENFMGDSQATILSPPMVEKFEIVNSLLSPFDISKMDYPSDSSKWEELQQQIEGLLISQELASSKTWQAYEDDLEGYQRSYETGEQPPTGENNPAVRALFGYALDNDASGARGNVVLSDLYLEPKKEAEKIFSHVAIDRFTGGARDGMLFQQKATSADAFTLDIYVKQEALADEQVRTSLEHALDDICKGNLQLGGGTAKGHGVFEGSCKIINA